MTEVTIIQGRDTPQETFGEMLAICLKRSKPEAYRGDLYHDALWIKKHFHEAKEKGGFFWSLRTSGTWLDFEKKNVDIPGSDSVVYFVRLENV